jgi:hypothetical protein
MWILVNLQIIVKVFANFNVIQFTDKIYVF